MILGWIQGLTLDYQAIETKMELIYTRITT